MDSEGVYLSRIFLEFFPKLVYFTMVAGKFQIYGIKITIKYICQPKNSCCSFLLMPPSKTLSQVFIIPPPRQKEITHSSQTVFSEDLFFPQQKEGKRIMELKKLPKLNLQGY